MKKMSHVCCIGYASPTAFDLMSRRLNNASPHSSESKQPNVRLCQLDKKNSATLLYTGT